MCTCAMFNCSFWWKVPSPPPEYLWSPHAAWSQGDPRKVIYPTDSRGQFCGQAGTPLEWVPCHTSVLYIYLWKSCLIPDTKPQMLCCCSHTTGRSLFSSISTSWNVPVPWSCWSSSVPLHRSETLSTHPSCSLACFLYRPADGHDRFFLNVSSCVWKAVLPGTSRWWKPS